MNFNYRNKQNSSISLFTWALQGGSSLAGHRSRIVKYKNQTQTFSKNALIIYINYLHNRQNFKDRIVSKSLGYIINFSIKLFVDK